MLSVTVSLQVFDAAVFPNVITSEMRLQTRAGVALDVPFFRIGGTVIDPASVPIASAGVRVVERGRSTLTAADGTFSLSAIPAGSFTLRVTSGTATQDRAITVPAPVLDDYNVQLT
jgi:hypothetical protein